MDSLIALFFFLLFLGFIYYFVFLLHRLAVASERIACALERLSSRRMIRALQKWADLIPTVEEMVQEDKLDSIPAPPETPDPNPQ